MRKFAVFMATLTVLMSGCFPLYGPNGSVVSVGSSLPAITSFYATPPVLTSGQSSTLVWNVTGATNVSINPGIGSVGTSGSVTVTPYASTTYTLTAGNSYGNSTASATITVNPMASPPVVNNFTVSPSFINPGQSATLTWNVTGADSVRIDPDVGTVPSSGSQTVSPGSTTTYILTAASSAGVITGNTIVSVSTYPTYSSSTSAYPPYPVYSPDYSSGYLPVIISFGVNPPDISPGEATTMNWDVSGADSVYITGIGSVPPVGYIALAPSVNNYYTLTATNTYGSSTASATVTVYPLYYYNYSQPIVVNPQPFDNERNERGQRDDRGRRGPIMMRPPPTQLSPTSTSPSTNPPPTPPVTPPVTPPAPQGGEQARVPRIESFGSSPPQVDLGRPTQLQWKVNGATSVNISPDIGPVPPSGTMTVAPNHTTVYTITASNSAGVVQHPEEVTVPRKFENTKQ